MMWMTWILSDEDTPKDAGNAGENLILQVHDKTLGQENPAILNFAITFA